MIISHSTNRRNYTISKMAQNQDGGAGEWRVPDLLEKMIQGEELTEDQIKFLVRGICEGFVDACQLGELSFLFVN